MSMNVPPTTGPGMPPPAGGQPGSATRLPPRPTGAPRPQQAHPHAGLGGMPPPPSAPPRMPPPMADDGAPGADMPRGASDPRFGYSSAAPYSSRGRKAALIKQTLFGAFASIKAIIHDGPMPNTQPGAPDGQSYSASYPQYMQPNQATQGGSMLKMSGNVFMGLMLLQSLGTGAIVSMLPSMLLLGAVSLGASYLWHRFRQQPRQPAGGADDVSSNGAPRSDYQMYAGGPQTSAQAPGQAPQYGQPQYGPPQLPFQPPHYGQAQQPPQAPQYGQPQPPTQPPIYIHVEHVDQSPQTAPPPPPQQAPVVTALPQGAGHQPTALPPAPSVRGARPPKQTNEPPARPAPQRAAGLVTVPPGASAPGAAVRRPIAALEAGPSARAATASPTAPAGDGTANPVDPRIAGWGPARPVSRQRTTPEPRGFLRTAATTEETPASETP